MIHSKDLVHDTKVQLSKSHPLVRLVTNDLAMWTSLIKLNPYLPFNHILGCSEKFVQAFSDASGTIGMGDWVIWDRMLFY